MYSRPFSNRTQQHEQKPRPVIVTDCSSCDSGGTIRARKEINGILYFFAFRCPDCGNADAKGLSESIRHWNNQHGFSIERASDKDKGRTDRKLNVSDVAGLFT